MPNFKKAKGLYGLYAWLVTIVIIALYLCGLYHLKKTGVLSAKEVVQQITILLGWGVAILIGLIHLNKSRKNSEELSKDEIRDKFRIDAFRSIQKGIDRFNDVLSEISSSYLFWPGKLRLQLKFPEVSSFDPHKLDFDISEHIIKFCDGQCAFIRSIEPNEIAVVQFDHFRKFIHLRAEKSKQSIDSFRSWLNANNSFILVNENTQDKFTSKCKITYEELDDLLSFLYDYRIELMNSMLGNIFASHVPQRKPKDPKFKTLQEVANKEDIEREWKEWENKLLQTPKD